MTDSIKPVKFPGRKNYLPFLLLLSVYYFFIVIP